ncbi:hypothetical protein vBCbaSRXM_81 [Citromicrobium phage vB_CbaS-RXM]|nr:hypothetical protein vBCbaSRXM_81 [Citromicrobium phage vB_CbaS-RXM]
MSDSSPLTAASDDVRKFVETSGMTKVDLEPLLGLSGSSKGKTLTRWMTYGATPIATILMAYIAEYGLDLAKKLQDADGVDLTIDPKQAE